MDKIPGIVQCEGRLNLQYLLNGIRFYWAVWRCFHDFHLYHNYEPIMMVGFVPLWRTSKLSSCKRSLFSNIFLDIGNVSAIPLSFIIFNDASLFPMTSVTEDLETNGEDFMIKTQVISASVGEENVTLDDLPESDPVIIRLRLFVSILHQFLHRFSHILIHST